MEVLWIASYISESANSPRLKTSSHWFMMILQHSPLNCWGCAVNSESLKKSASWTNLIFLYKNVFHAQDSTFFSCLILKYVPEFQVQFESFIMHFYFYKHQYLKKLLILRKISLERVIFPFHPLPLPLTFPFPYFPQHFSFLTSIYFSL